MTVSKDYIPTNRGERLPEVPHIPSEQNDLSLLLRASPNGTSVRGLAELLKRRHEMAHRITPAVAELAIVHEAALDPGVVDAMREVQDTNNSSGQPNTFEQVHQLLGTQLSDDTEAFLRYLEHPV